MLPGNTYEEAQRLVHGFGIRKDLCHIRFKTDHIANPLAPRPKATDT